MFEQLIWYLKGYVRIRITGYSPERFLNACRYKNIYIWDLKRVCGSYEMNLTIDGFRRLKEIVRKTGTKVCIIRRSGLPFLLHRYRKRHILLSGFLICAGLILFMTRFIWGIDISGNLSYTDDTLKRFLSSENVKDGMKKSDVNCRKIVQDLRKKYDRIIWVSASVDGCRLVIRIKENEDDFTDSSKISSDNNEEGKDIIADTDCTIVDIITRTGTPMVQRGTKVKKGSKIYLNAQTWAVLADVADDEKLPELLRSVDEMERDFGFPLNDPPYQIYDAHVGRMSGMLPGLFENGGVYCHATGFKILMDCKVGRASKALQTLKKIMPDSEKNPSSRSGAEPYVFTNCYSTHPGYYGKSYQSWTTGTSVWCLMGIYEGIMGVKRDYEGLKIVPCFPAEWENAEMTRHFRGADYHIVIQNPQHVENGKGSLFVDGKPCLESVLPDFRDGKMHEVEVKISQQ